MTTSTCWALFGYQPCLPAEAWAAWAQAILSAGAIIAAVALANYQVRRGEKSNQELQDRANAIAIAQTAGLFYLAGDSVLRRMSMEAEFKTRNKKEGFWYRDEFLRDLAFFEAMSLDALPLGAVEAALAFRFTAGSFENTVGAVSGGWATVNLLDADVHDARVQLERLKAYINPPITE